MCFADGHTVAENTGSLLTSEVQRHRAWLVLGWGTAWEDLRVLSAFTISFLQTGRRKPSANRKKEKGQGKQENTQAKKHELSV